MPISPTSSGLWSYLGTGIITGVRKPPGRALTEAERKLNKDIAEIRVPVAHVIAQVKQWQVLATGSRGRLNELPDAIATVEDYSEVPCQYLSDPRLRRSRDR